MKERRLTYIHFLFLFIYFFFLGNVRITYIHSISELCIFINDMFSKSTSSSLPILVPFLIYKKNFTKTHKNHPTIDTPNLHFFGWVEYLGSIVASQSLFLMKKNPSLTLSVLHGKALSPLSSHVSHFLLLPRGASHETPID
jgi:hypothetical protein